MKPVHLSPCKAALNTTLLYILPPQVHVHQSPRSIFLRKQKFSFSTRFFDTLSHHFVLIFLLLPLFLTYFFISLHVQRICSNFQYSTISISSFPRACTTKFLNLFNLGGVHRFWREINGRNPRVCIRYRDSGG